MDLITKSEVEKLQFCALRRFFVCSGSLQPFL
jgi:hypothetical protein